MIKSRPKVQKRGRPTIRRDQGEAGEWRRAKYRRNRCSPIVCMNVNASPLFSLSSSLIFSHFFPSRLFPACRFHRSSPLSLSPNAFGNIFPILLTVLLLVLLPNFNGKLKKKKKKKNLCFCFESFDILQIVVRFVRGKQRGKKRDFVSRG